MSEQRYRLTEDYKGNFAVPIRDNLRKSDEMMITEVVYDLNEYDKRIDEKNGINKVMIFLLRQFEYYFRDDGASIKDFDHKDSEDLFRLGAETRKLLESIDVKLLRDE